MLSTTFDRVVALSFVIPSEAEGSAVLRTFRGNAKFYPQTELSSRPERSVVERSAFSFLGSALLQPIHQVYLRQQPGIAVHVCFTVRAEENIRQVAKPSLV